MELQERLDAVEKQIQSCKHAIAAGHDADIELTLTILTNMHAEFTAKVDDLYAKVELLQDLPEIRGHSVQFLHTLLQAHEAKRVCRARIIGRFSEWERLDAAVGGKEEAMGKFFPSPLRCLCVAGTSLHQRTRTALKKRLPALLRSVTRYNDLCKRLRELRPAESTFPLPEELSTDFAKLRNDDSLLLDVYLADSTAAPPAWVTDARVRKGIRAMHTLARCEEETRRLEWEEHNVHTWIRDEQDAISAALSDISSACIHSLVTAHLTSAQDAHLAPFLVKERERIERMTLLPAAPTSRRGVTIVKLSTLR